VGDTNAGAALVQQSDHCFIVGRDQCGEVVDAFLAATIGQPAQQLGGQPAALPVVDDGDCDLRRLRVLALSDVARGRGGRPR
jgi:hypothetical protein